MRSNTSTILGGPIASWALYGCLALAGMSWQAAGFLALAWGAFWIGLSHLERLPRWIARAARARRRSVRRRLTDAILATLFLPLPVYAFALAIQWFEVAPATLTLSLLVVLALPVPVMFWWAALRPVGFRKDALHPVLVRVPQRPVH